MAIKEVNLRALRNEAHWIPSTLEELSLVRQTLIDAGISDQIANGLTGWLLAKANGQPDGTESKTRARYRKILAGLESPIPSELRAPSSVPILRVA